MGTSSGTRSAACSSSSAIGSGRSAPGSHTAWLESGGSDRHDLPPEARRAGESHRATGARADGPGGRRAGLRPAVAMRSPNSPAPGDEAPQPLTAPLLADEGGGGVLGHEAANSEHGLLDGDPVAHAGGGAPRSASNAGI